MSKGIARLPRSYAKRGSKLCALPFPTKGLNSIPSNFHDNIGGINLFKYLFYLIRFAMMFVEICCSIMRIQ